MTEYIYKSSGTYLGFLDNDNLFDRDGNYLGWAEDYFVWDKIGQFKGNLKEIEGNKFILRDQFTIAPVPKLPRPIPPRPNLPNPPPNVKPVPLPLGHKDAF